MTLAPVFRSAEAVEALQQKGHLEKMQPSLDAMRKAVEHVHGRLDRVVAPKYVDPAGDGLDELSFLQEHFFLILFDSVFRTLGCDDDERRLLDRLNVCIKGLVAAGDNLFDDEAKQDLPLKLSAGSRFRSIVQMLVHDHSLQYLLTEHRPEIPFEAQCRFRQGLLTRLIEIGTLEGSEESGVDSVPTLEEMIERVHRVRGGQLFSLAFIAPEHLLAHRDDARWRQAEEGIFCLGTAFQLVDDITDFEFDMTRRSYNAVASQMTHCGGDEERSVLQQLIDGEQQASAEVDELIARAAGEVLARATQEAERGFTRLADLGFWFPPSDAELFAKAIAGDAGDRRIRHISQAATYQS